MSDLEVFKTMAIAANFNITHKSKTINVMNVNGGEYEYTDIVMVFEVAEKFSLMFCNGKFLHITNEESENKVTTLNGAIKYIKNNQPKGE